MIPPIKYAMEDRQYNVDDLVKAYMAGLVDGAGSFLFRISAVDDYDVGYSVGVTFRLNSNRDSVLSDFASWAEDQGFDVTIKSQNTVRLNKTEDVSALIETLRPFLRSKSVDAELLNDEIIPRIERGDHLEESGLIELMGHVEQLPSYDVNRRKYSQDYFIQEFTDEREA